jgi:3-hydroxyacyl-[acyl-carrier-protein] dehydratase
MSVTDLSPMDIHQILQYLPHRYPFLLIDRVLELELEPGKRILALKNVSINEPFFPGHFPHFPVMPGVLIIEAMAQAAAVLSFKLQQRTPDNSTVYYFAGIDDARFKRPVTPGDQLHLDVRLIALKRGLYKFSAHATVNGQTAAEGEILCTERSVA